MNLEQLFENPEVITPNQSQELNKDLATKSLSDIPEEYRSDIEMFLSTQLNLNAVQPELIESLDSLVKEIQNAA